MTLPTKFTETAAVETRLCRAACSGYAARRCAPRFYRRADAADAGRGTGQEHREDAGADREAVRGEPTILPTINPPPNEEYRHAIADAGIEIVETAGSNPSRTCLCSTRTGSRWC